ncbi:MAG: SRPBCC domain-containing protein [Chloroflexi bacterium]|nr:SRPBCC domain-containing protein [Chloroflexota bacterium]
MPKNIARKIEIAVPIEQVWAALTDPAVIGGWMGSKGLKVTLRRGGRYALFGGETTGKFTEIKKPARLEYTWRQSSWKKEWADSVVRWELKAKNGGTVIKLTHSQFPNKEERDGHDEGWDVYFLKPMKEWLES